MFKQFKKTFPLNCVLLIRFYTANLWDDVAITNKFLLPIYQNKLVFKFELDDEKTNIFMTNHFFKNFLYQEALTVKLESVHKLNMQVKQKYDDLKSMCTAKDELIARLENEMKELSLFVEKTIKVFVIILLSDRLDRYK